MYCYNKTLKIIKVDPIKKQKNLNYLELEYGFKDLFKKILII
jgi:hypothetical protein